jgi:hypothetical protein
MKRRWFCIRWGRAGVPVAAATALAVGFFSPDLFAPGLFAEDAQAPARAVRLSSVDGKVQISQGSQTIADQAVVNTPLFEGSLVATADDGRAEIQFEDGSVARLSPNSSLTLTALKPDEGAASTAITLNSGLGYFELQSGGQAGHIEVHFGDAVATASGSTVLRPESLQSSPAMPMWSAEVRSRSTCTAARASP